MKELSDTVCRNIDILCPEGKQSSSTGQRLSCAVSQSAW